MGKKENQKSNSLNRRQFVGGAAALATSTATLALGDTSLAEVSSVPECKTPGCDYDVVVIGGGFGGVTAARDSQKSAFSEEYYISLLMT